MTIACLGWGSLIWDPGTLPIRPQWFDDGPPIKVEFARQSSGGRITLVILDSAPLVRSLWAAMDLADVVAAKDALRKREGNPHMKHIGHWQVGEKAPRSIPHLPDWAVAHGVDAVIWTALPPKFADENNRVPKADEVLAYLGRLEGSTRDDAERYIRLAPRQIDTPYRRKIETELGWTPLDK